MERGGKCKKYIVYKNETSRTLIDSHHLLLELEDTACSSIAAKGYSSGLSSQIPVNVFDLVWNNDKLVGNVLELIVLEKLRNLPTVRVFTRLWQQNR